MRVRRSSRTGLLITGDRVEGYAAIRPCGRRWGALVRCAPNPPCREARRLGLRARSSTVAAKQSARHLRLGSRSRPRCCRPSPRRAPQRAAVGAGGAWSSTVSASPPESTTNCFAAGLLRPDVTDSVEARLQRALLVPVSHGDHAPRLIEDLGGPQRVARADRNRARRRIDRAAATSSGPTSSEPGPRPPRPGAVRSARSASRRARSAP